MFDNMSIAKRMSYLIGMATFSVLAATIFVFVAFTKIEGEYEHLRSSSMVAGLTTLQIEKNMNYVSRNTRDIMLGGNFDKDIAKLKKSINSINTDFNTLEELMQNDNFLPLAKKAKTSTMLFLNNSLVKNTLEHAQEIITNFEKMEDASAELFTLMDKMIEESR